MSIPERLRAGKDQIARIPVDTLFAGILVLSVLLAFILGVLAGREMAVTKDPGFWIENLKKQEPAVQSMSGGPASAYAAVEAIAESAPQAESPKAYVASKSGTKYYLPSCSGVKRIKEENKVWFATADEAEAAGYTPAANCPGL